MKSTREIKYFIYCRKSSESEERQTASIGDQVDALQRVVDSEQLTVVNSFAEEKSSKSPGRPKFNEMLDRIDAGEANGVLCWDIDRLYRNPVDEGRLRWLLQRGLIQVIRTPNRTFGPEDAGLLMGVEGGRAIDFNIRLSKNVRRAFRGKIEKGWRPGPVPIGYMNVGDVGNKTVAIDLKRFDMVRRLWDLYLTGQYSVRELNHIVNDTWGLRTPTRRRQGNKPLSMSHMYRILNDPFYYGKFLWRDPDTGGITLYDGAHDPMITEEEYRRAQVLLGTKGKPQPKEKEFAYTGLFTCGECGSGVTAEEKHQLICSQCKYKFAHRAHTACPKCKTEISAMHSPKILEYVYYHCTKKKGPCSQPSLRIEEFEKQFAKKLDELHIDSEYMDVALDYLRDTQHLEVHDQKKITEALQRAHSNAEECLKRLHAEYTSSQNKNHEIYTPEEFAVLKREAKAERDRIKIELDAVEKRTDVSLDMTERTFNFCTLAKKRFEKGDKKMRRLILSSIGSNLTLKDKKLSIELLHPFQLIRAELQSQAMLNIRFEPKNSEALKGKTGIFVPVSPVLKTLLRG